MLITPVIPIVLLFALGCGDYTCSRGDYDLLLQGGTTVLSTAERDLKLPEVVFEAFRPRSGDKDLLKLLAEAPIERSGSIG